MSSATTDKRRSRGTAVVTGASQGIGRVFARALAAAGHDIAILDLSPAQETLIDVRAEGSEGLSFEGDASDPETVDAFGKQVRSHLRPVRVVVNNAGISPYAPFHETDLAMWHQVMRVNLDSLFLITHQFLPELIADGNGRIVNLTSSVVSDLQARNMSAYATTKAGIIGFTRALAGELGVHGVTVNCIAPGIVLTPDIADRVPAERLEEYRNRQSIKHLATAEDLESAMEFLVDERSRQVTAIIVPVNGGRVVA